MSATPDRIYLSGPMSGCEEHNFPAFHAAAVELASLGWAVINPATNFGGRLDLARDVYLRRDIELLLTCQAICMLDGWQKSAGASLEYLLARELGFAVTMLTPTGLHDLVPLPRAEVVLSTDLRLVDETPPVVTPVEPAAKPLPILEEAARLTDGPRQADYDHPRNAFSRAAMIWTAILAHRLMPGQAVHPAEVPLCMIGSKLARQAHKHKRDNLIDMAGYARTIAMIAGDE